MLSSSWLMNRASPQKFSGLYLASLALAEQEELVVQARSTLGALVAGIFGKQAELLISILKQLHHIVVHKWFWIQIFRLETEP